MKSRNLANLFPFLMDGRMKSHSLTNVLLFLILVLLLITCIQNMSEQKVVLYQDGTPVGSRVRSTRSNALPVHIVDY